MKFDHTFADPALLALALTHPSAVQGQLAHNQRLEFLGDAVLQLLVTERLYAAHPDWTEGQLSKARAAIVRKETLAALADELGVTAHLRLGAGDLRMGTARSVNVRSDAIEAVIGAVYLDGGFAAVRTAFGPSVDPLLSAPAADHNPRSRLQEWLEARGLERPEYVELPSTGPAHALTFRYEVLAAGERFGPAPGSSKAAAMAAAAQLAVAALIPSG